MKKRVSFYLLSGLLLFSMQGLFAQKVSIETLLKEMVNREEQARYPEPGFINRQFSSYDRETVGKDQPGWFANSDRSMFLRVENRDGRKEFVMMDTDGPGAIVRFWMTFSGENCGKGTMRIYIDDDAKPTIEGPAFDILSGNIITGTPLATSVSGLSPYENRGHNLYFPIPYARHCKVTYQSEHLFEDDFGARRRGTESVYYNINYRTYDPAVQVVSYSRGEMGKNKSLIDRVQKQLANKTRGIEKKSLTRLSLNAGLKPGKSKSFELEGTYAIQHLSILLSAADKNQALRSTVLEMRFDGEKTVWAPLGDFFCTGYHPLYTNLWYLQSDKDGAMNAYWVMPFAKACTITLHNLGEQEVQLSNSFAAYAPWKWDNRSMHFGTNWQLYRHEELGLQDSDVNFTTLEGKGIYVGDGVTLFNSSYHWWGEGDEKVYVDGESFPSHIGTGSEDYYGYAWCRPETFTDHPFIAQPYGNGSFEHDFSVNTRLRALDGIPFHSSLEVTIEVYRRHLNYATVAFWYLFPGGKTLVKEDIAGVKAKVIMERKDMYPARLELAVEGEELDIPRRPETGSVLDQIYLKEQWSGKAQLQWNGAQKGKKLFLEFQSDYPGAYTLSALITRNPSGGIFKVFINDALAGIVDLYQADRTTVKKTELGKVNLKQGYNTLVFELDDYPGKGTDVNLGLDKLIFVKQ
ncbi:hypothetical protein FACS1894181_02260 [Bacteroidia bacterium]|nr:hypothetical protein FACS1894181_02260 [Bacteroidia bacterium]